MVRARLGKRVVVPHSARAMGMRITGTRGAGKSRLLGRLLAWSDVQAGIPIVIIDPVGALADNLIDVMLRLPRSEQERLRLRGRVIYVDMAGTGSDGHVCPFPLLYRLGEETLYDQAMRFVSVTLKTDPSLSRAPVLGANALAKIGLDVGMLLAALGCQLTEAEDLLNAPHRWAGRIAQARARYPDQLQEAARYFLEVYPRLPERERQYQTSAYRHKLSLFASPVLRAMYGADHPGIDWSTVAATNQCVVLDFRNVPEYQKRFAVVWAFYGLVEWIRRRGPGRHHPLSLIVDEATYVLSEATALDDPLAADLEELLGRLARNAQIWVTVAHQELHQLNDHAARLFMDLGTQVFGRTADVDAAITIARRFSRYNPRQVKKREPMYMRDPAGVYVIDERSTEYSMAEQAYLNALPLLDLPAFTFLVGVAPREGELPTRLDRVSIADDDKDRFVQEELVREARALLMAAHPQVSDLLTAGAARLEESRDVPPTSSPDTVEWADRDAPLKRRERASRD